MCTVGARENGLFRESSPIVLYSKYDCTSLLGPDTPPLGERTNCGRVTQSQIAATLAAFVGEDFHAIVADSGPPIEQVLPTGK